MKTCIKCCLGILEGPSAKNNNEGPMCSSQKRELF